MEGREEAVVEEEEVVRGESVRGLEEESVREACTSEGEERREEGGNCSTLISADGSGEGVEELKRGHAPC